MSFRRVIAGILGVAIFGFAAVATVSPSLARSLPVGVLVSLLGNDYFLLVVVAAVAVLLTLAVTISARNGARDHTTPPDAEQVTNVPLAGDSYDDVFTNSGFWALTHPDECETVRRNLRATATRLIQTETGCTQSAAEERIERGTWTDDRYAASYLGRRAPRPGFVRWLTTLLRFETLGQRGARHTAAEIIRRTGGDGRVA